MMIAIQTAKTQYRSIRREFGSSAAYAVLFAICSLCFAPSALASESEAFCDPTAAESASAPPIKSSLQLLSVALTSRTEYEECKGTEDVIPSARWEKLRTRLWNDPRFKTGHSNLDSIARTALISRELDAEGFRSQQIAIFTVGKSSLPYSANLVTVKGASGSSVELVIDPSARTEPQTLGEYLRQRVDPAKIEPFILRKLDQTYVPAEHGYRDPGADYNAKKAKCRYRTQLIEQYEKRLSPNRKPSSRK